MRLLFRFYNPTEGEILVAGQPITKVTQKSLRQAMGVVPQDTVLFNESVRFNIRYGNPSAPIEDVVAAAKGAEIHDSIVSFPGSFTGRSRRRFVLFAVSFPTAVRQLGTGTNQPLPCRQMVTTPLWGNEDSSSAAERSSGLLLRAPCSRCAQVWEERATCWRLW